MANLSHRPHRLLFPFASVAMLAASPLILPACSSTPPDERHPGQSEFTSAPPAGQRQGGRDTSGSASPPQAEGDSASSSGAGGGAAPRTVEETDLYRLEGDRLYYLNAYRGLMVFDVSDIDHPQLLGRSAIYGSPVEMIVRDGVAVVVVSDWYGTADDGQPFHGSIVRGIDAHDPANIHSLGEARLGGWVRDTRIVGDVLYAVSEDYGWYYGVWDGGYYGGAVGTATGPKVVVSSVSFSNGVIEAKGHEEFTGYSGVFNVTDSAIIMAHDTSDYTTGQYSSTSELQYVDIHDAGGSISLRGTMQVKGNIQGWGADNGRWNLDFADKRYAHVLTQAPYNGNPNGLSYVLTTVDWLDPNAPLKTSEFNISSAGWSPAARFDGGRMYLSPENVYWGNPNTPTTPIQIYDISNPALPSLAGSADITGVVWNFFPAGNRLFALGNEFESGPQYSSQVSLRYLDVTNPTSPSVIGTSTFGDGWAWTPAAGTFKAFAMDATQGLVVLPFSGWSYDSNEYNNGLQLIEFTPSSITTKGAAKTKGWVERGIFVKNRLVSLSDLSLSVVAYADRSTPTITAELTLARNVISAQPQGGTIAELSTDWWGNDLTSSELRVLPVASADDATTPAAVSASIDGIDARVFRNGNFAYITSRVREEVACDSQNQPSEPEKPGGGPGTCWTYAVQVQVVDLANNQATLRGKTKLPSEPNWYGWGGGFYGCFWWDWYDGADAIQVDGDALAFRRWVPTYSPTGLQEWDQKLYVVDLADADHPTLASTLITPAPDAWWGNMRAVGDKLYASHYEWVTLPTPTSSQPVVKYYLDQIDLSDRHNPTVGAKINVPGLLVGASSSDPSILYTIDYRWTGNTNENELAVIELDGNLAYLQSTITIDGWVGNVFIQNDKAYMSAEHYVDSGVPNTPGDGPRIKLHEIDLTDPQAPVDRVSTEKSGWGWLLGVEGDRAIITSGWGGDGIDIYQLNPNAAPTFDQFVRTRGWGTSSLARQGNQLFLSSGYWGVQVVDL